MGVTQSESHPVLAGLTDEDRHLLPLYLAATVPPCRCVDVAVRLTHVKTATTSFYRIGTVPCQAAHLVGLVVGLVPGDGRATLLVDDGTAVLDCLVFAHATTVADVGSLRIGHVVNVKGRLQDFRDQIQLRVEALGQLSLSLLRSTSLTCDGLHQTS